MLAYAVSRETTLAGIVSVIGAVGAVLLGLVLLRGLDELLPWAAVLLGVAYAMSLLVHDSGVDTAAPLVAAGLLLCTELAAWSLDERDAIAAERAVWLGRAAALGALVAAALAASGLVVALSLTPASGLAWTVLGAAASVLLVGLAVRLARRPA